MKENQKLRVVLMGLLIIVNIFVFSFILQDEKGNSNELKLSTNEEASIDKDLADEDIEYDDDIEYKEDNEILTSSNLREESISDVNHNNQNDYLDDTNNTNNVTDSTGNKINNITNENNINDSNSDNSGTIINNNHQNQVNSSKNYLNQMECKEYMTEMLGDKYEDNNGITVHNISLAYMNDDSMGVNSVGYGCDELVFYIVYFLNSELPKSYARDRHELRRVALINSVSRKINDFGYLNGRKFIELGFSNVPNY